MGDVLFLLSCCVGVIGAEFGLAVFVGKVCKMSNHDRK